MQKRASKLVKNKFNQLNPSTQVVVHPKVYLGENIIIENRLEKFLQYLSDYEEKGNDVSFVRIKEKLEAPYVPKRHTLFSLTERYYIPNRTDAG